MKLVMCKILGECNASESAIKYSLIMILSGTVTFFPLEGVYFLPRKTVKYTFLTICCSDFTSFISIKHINKAWSDFSSKDIQNLALLKLILLYPSFEQQIWVTISYNNAKKCEQFSMDVSQFILLIAIYDLYLT